MTELQKSQQLVELYKQKYVSALQEIETLKKRLTHYTDQSWELENARQELYDRSYTDWK